MANKHLPKPTEAELAILNVLWKQGSSTVRSVHERLYPDQKMAYTTTLKQMQIMLEKGLVKRDTSARTHIYEAVLNERTAQQAMLDSLLDRAFSGSASNLVMQTLGRHKPSPEELKQIRDLLDNLENQGS